MKKLPLNRVLVGDALSVIDSLPASSVDAIITSPPYFQLRDYQVDGQLGLEADVDQWVDELLLVFRGLVRVLSPSGSVWLNLGDSYSRHDRFGAPAKSLLLGPERLAQRLMEDGWIVRNKVIWAKTRSMPTSVKDRLACTWEVLYFLTKSQRYFFDLDAIRLPHASKRAKAKSTTATYPPASAIPASWAGPLAGSNAGLANLKRKGLVGHPLGRNPGDVWRLPSANFRGAHFATFPESLIEQPMLASVPERVCVRCGAAWRRESKGATQSLLTATCDCDAAHRPGIVLDPFMGSGTVGVVASQLGRDWLGIELNPNFARLAESRISQAQNSRRRNAA